MDREELNARLDAVLVTVGDPDDEATFVPALEGAGYEVRVHEPDREDMNHYADAKCPLIAAILARAPV